MVIYRNYNDRFVRISCVLNYINTGLELQAGIL